MKTTKKDSVIQKLLANNSFGWIAENKTVFKYFKKSDYFQELKDDLVKYKDNEYEIDDSVNNYAQKFGEDVRHLNLY